METLTWKFYIPLGSIGLVATIYLFATGGMTGLGTFALPLASVSSLVTGILDWREKNAQR